MNADAFSFLFGLLAAIWILMRIAKMAERTRTQQAREELIREVVRQKIRQKKIDELYGRGEE